MVASTSGAHGPTSGTPASRRSALLERTAELSRLDLVLEAAEHKTGRLALVGGAPGLGKSRLLDEVRGRAAGRGLTVLAARCSELERSFGFGAVHQLLDPVLRTTSEAERDRLLTGAARLAEPLLTGAGGVSGPPHDPSYGVLHGLYWLVANLADRAPVLVAVDDAQWIDRPSGRFLEFLAPRLDGIPVGVVIAAREHRGVVDVEPAPSLVRQADERIELRPLSLDAVRPLVDAHLGKRADDQLQVACRDATGGNPFLLHELLGELRRRRAAGDPLDPAVIDRLGPRAIPAAVLGRVGQVEGAAQVARAVAVLGERTSLGEVAALTGLASAVVARTADALADATVLEVGSLRFVHPIVRAAVYEDIPAALRSDLHAAAARLAEERGAAIQVVATHLMRTEPRNNDWVVETLRRAAEAALASGAAEPAIDFLRRALAEPPGDEVRPRLHHMLGAALAQAGDAEAAAPLHEALRLAADPELRARVAFDLAQMQLIGGELVAAVEVLEDALSTVPEECVELAGRIEGQLLLFGTTAVSGRQRLRGRLSAAAQRIDQLPPAQARFLRPALAFDRAVGAGADADEATALACRALGDSILLQEVSDASIIYGATEALWVTGRCEESERAVDAIVESAQRRGSARGFAMSSAMRAWRRYLRGNLPGAEADARACLESDASLALVTPLAATALSGVLLERGELREAVAVLAPFDSLRHDADFGFVQLLHIKEAQLALARGDAALARARLELCRQFEISWGANAGLACAIGWRSPAALAELARGDHAEAIVLAEEQVAHAREFGVARWLGVALRVHGCVVRGSRAVTLLEESVAVLEPADAAVEHARSLVELGAALRRSGRRGDARTPLAQGMDLAHRRGAAALARRAREELVAAGARPRRLAISGRDALTASERRVAAMACEGLTNRQIAQRLFVTQRTVEGHLSNAFAKLGVESRDRLEQALGVDTV